MFRSNHVAARISERQISTPAPGTSDLNSFLPPKLSKYRASHLSQGSDTANSLPRHRHHLTGTSPAPPHATRCHRGRGRPSPCLAHSHISQLTPVLASTAVISSLASRRRIIPSDSYCGRRPAPTGELGLELRFKVVIDNGLLQLTLSNPGGLIRGIQYNGIYNLLELHNPDLNGGWRRRTILMPIRIILPRRENFKR